MAEAASTKVDYKFIFSTYLSLLAKQKFWLISAFALLAVAEITTLADKWLLKWVIDTASAASITTKLLFAGVGAYSLIIFAQIACKWLSLHALNNLEVNLIFALKQKYFSHILRLSHSFHTTHRTGSLISRLVRGGNAMECVTDSFFFTSIPILIQIVAVSGMIFLLNPTSALIVLVTVAVYLTYEFFVNKFQQPALVAANNAEDAEKAAVSDFFTNIESIAYFGKERAVENKYGKLAKLSKETQLREWNFFRYMDAGQIAILGFGTIGILIMPLLDVMHNSLGIGSMVFIYTAFGNMIAPLSRVSWGMRQFYRGIADMQALTEYGKIEQEVKDRPHAQALKVRHGAIAFQNITFAYKKRYILENFNLTVAPHSKIAIVGHSGSGKSTLVKLLYRFYDVQKGEILIDGIDVRDMKQDSLRSELAIVPQEGVLFDDTIYNNIAFSDPQASKKRVFAAIRFAQLDRIISSFPQKENTIVGERGIKLSGGEKQRVSLARALLADKRILVLDEATSSLDSQTEHDIQHDLAELMKGRTCIMIAHRLSTIMSADKIVVIEKGRIVQAGTHNELISQPGLYKKLWSLQKGGYIKS